MSLESELRHEQVVHLDLSAFSEVASGTPVHAALARLREERHNVCLVTEKGRLVGIFTDRDVLRKVADTPTTLAERIDELMSRNPITVLPTTSAAAALQLMDANHFRNLPVVQADGKLVGNMTHKAIIDFLAARYPVEVLNRPPRPEQFPRKPEGG